MSDRMFVVIEYNQASHQPDLAYYGVFDHQEDAEETAADKAQDARSRGRRETYQVFELVEAES